jgi:hypothetical protein
MNTPATVLGYTIAPEASVFDAVMTRCDQQRAEEHAAMDRDHFAHQRLDEAIVCIQRQCRPYGNGVPSDQSLHELELAAQECRKADNEISRIAEEILSGKRWVAGP